MNCIATVALNRKTGKAHRLQQNRREAASSKTAVSGPTPRARSVGCCRRSRLCACSILAKSSGENGWSRTRLGFTAGDFFVDDLPRADVLVMGMILHDWDLPAKRLLIGKAHAALEKGGSLIIYEFLIDDARRTHLPGLLMSLNMLIETRGGFDYTGADCLGWKRDAGFAEGRVVPLVGPHSAVIATK